MPAALKEGVNIIREGATDTSYTIDEGKAVMIASSTDTPIVFEDCTFDLSGETVKISGDQDGISYNNAK